MSKSFIPPLPLKNGVAPSRVWLEPGPWTTLGEFLQQRFPHVSPQVLAQRLQRGDMVDSQGATQHAHTPYRPEQWLWYYRLVEDEVPVPFEMPILHVDERLIVVDKPHFLATIPTGDYLTQTALVRVRAQFNNAEITPLHRLDRDTAGVLVFCVQPQYRGAYQSLFQSRAVEKTYEAIAPTYVGPDTLPSYRRSHIAALGEGEFMMQEWPDREPNSETHIEELSRWSATGYDQGLSHYTLQPVTGRKHQLRVHLAAMGCPIVNDVFYPVWDKSRAANDFSRPLQLLARSLAFLDPIDGHYREFVSQQRLGLLAP